MQTADWQIIYRVDNTNIYYTYTYIPIPIRSASLANRSSSLVPQARVCKPDKSATCICHTA